MTITSSSFVAFESGLGDPEEEKGECELVDFEADLRGVEGDPAFCLAKSESSEPAF